MVTQINRWWGVCGSIVLIFLLWSPSAAQLVLKDRVWETSTTTGTGTISLGGVGGANYVGFVAAVGGGASTYYCMVHRTLNEWEMGVGTVTASPDTITRTTVLSSTNAGVEVNFSAGTKDVFGCIPAEFQAVPMSGTFPTGTGSVWEANPRLIDDGTGLAYSGANGITVKKITGDSTDPFLLDAKEGTLPSASAAGRFKIAVNSTDHKPYFSGNAVAFTKMALVPLDLASEVGTSRVPYANLTAATGASKLLGRGSSGSGDWQEVSLGAGLAMSGPTLSATGGGGGAASVLSFSTIPPNSNTVVGTAQSSLTTRLAYYFLLPFQITVNQMSLWFSSATTPGTLKLCVYTGDGATKVIDTIVTPATGVAVSGAVSAVSLNPGAYYLVTGCASACNVAAIAAPNEITSTLYGAGTPSGKTVWRGTVTHASGGCDSTLGTVTGGISITATGVRFDN